MRPLLVGLISLLCSAAAWGQVRAQVEAIGFHNLYRPDCWTPMLVSIRPESSEDATYLIQVEQRDSDGDRVVYTSPVTITGVRDGQSGRDFKKEVYFLPQATRTPGADRRGLADKGDPGGLKALQDQLKVFIATENGKQIAQALITTTIESIDPQVPPTATTRGVKLVLAVSDPDTGSQPNWSEYQDIYGVNESVRMVLLRPRELPESVLGYDAVDAVLFLNADPTDLKTPTDERWQALRQWVRQGGNLVICQPASWEKTLGFGDLLPVTLPRFGTGDAQVQGTLDYPARGPLYDMMMESAPTRGTQLEQSSTRSRINRAWSRATPPFRLGLAAPRPGAFVARWIEWPTKPDEPPLRTPYIARHTFGVGAVTWVAQDLGDRSVARISVGWPGVWDQVFGWNNQPYVQDPSIKDEDESLLHVYRPTSGVDLGEAMLSGMEHGRKGAGLVFLVVLFFVIYWVLAGPVSYWFLSSRKQSQLSWFAFAVAAVAATVLTTGVVELVLRGDPEVRHVSLVRLAADQSVGVQSRIGLYIPRDGPQTIALDRTLPGNVSYIAPFAYHPQHLQEVDFTAVLRYEVPVPAASDLSPPTVDIPYRTTLKKLQVQWVGDSRDAITGKVRLLEGMNFGGLCRLDGYLTNSTPHNLRNVYFAFLDHAGYDAICYVPTWNAGTTIDLQSITWHAIGTASQREALPGQGKAIADRLQRHQGAHDRWLTEYLLHSSWRSATGWDDAARGYSHSLPVLSLYNRIAPLANRQREMNRYEILRRNARHLDLSQAVAAGALAVFAVAPETPLPMPFIVEGDTIAGEGDTIYQAVLPLDRSQLPDPTTQPVEEEPQPAGSTPEVAGAAPGHWPPMQLSN